MIHFEYELLVTFNIYLSFQAQIEKNLSLNSRLPANHSARKVLLIINWMD